MITKPKYTQKRVYLFRTNRRSGLKLTKDDEYLVETLGRSIGEKVGHAGVPAKIKFKTRPRSSFIYHQDRISN